jgi:hypothetical protein
MLRRMRVDVSGRARQCLVSGEAAKVARRIADVRDRNVTECRQHKISHWRIRVLPLTARLCPASSNPQDRE